jgi:hypothetical protein
MRTIPCLVALIWTLPAWAALPPSLYEGQTIVTGTTVTRPEGLARCLREVLVKVSGDPALESDPRVTKLTGEAGSMAEDFVYFDRMSDIPYHDEQGSRDRPFTLIAHFAPARIDAALASLGSAPWRADRPRLLFRVAVTDRKGASFPMTADRDDDERLREALLAAGAQYGMPVVLQPQAQLGAKPPPDVVLLSGTLRWSDQQAGWVGDWRLDWHGRAHRWGISGVSFDDAFRDAVRGGMGVLSGHAGGR